jgi:hypothetical protein
MPALLRSSYCCDTECKRCSSTLATTSAPPTSAIGKTGSAPVRARGPIRARPRRCITATYCCDTECKRCSSTLATTSAPSTLAISKTGSAPVRARGPIRARPRRCITATYCCDTECKRCSSTLATTSSPANLGNQQNWLRASARTRANTRKAAPLHNRHLLLRHRVRTML